ncbi:hypothetical protein O0L34_g13447 [Tuta absoluta]|nr:hypothetical protein O0L34_g13447 [Tuta absoluta]
MEHLLTILRAKRGQYKNAMRPAEINHFRSVVDSGNEDTWGLAYWADSCRSRPPMNVLNCVDLLQAYTTTADGTMSGLLTARCPDDVPSRDTAYHRAIRVAAACAPSCDDSRTSSLKMLENIIKELPNTAPGTDARQPIQPESSGTPGRLVAVRCCS